MKIIPFNYMDEKEVRIIEQDGKYWWVAKDVCNILAVDTRDIHNRLEDDEKSYVDRNHLGLSPGKKMVLVNEPGLYTLILRSNKPEAKQFKKWITHEVLPTIRQTGIYHTPDVNPDFLRQIADKLERTAAERDEAIATKGKIAEGMLASAMGTASGAVKKLKAYEKKYGDGSHCAVKGITWLHQCFQKIDNFFPYSLIGSDLSQISDKQGHEIKKAPDEKYREVNSYHTEVIKIFKNLVKRGEVRPALKKYIKELPV